MSDMINTRRYIKVDEIDDRVIQIAHGNGDVRDVAEEDWRTVDVNTFDWDSVSWRKTFYRWRRKGVNDDGEN